MWYRAPSVGDWHCMGTCKTCGKWIGPSPRQKRHHTIDWHARLDAPAIPHIVAGRFNSAPFSRKGLQRKAQPANTTTCSLLTAVSDCVVSPQTPFLNKISGTETAIGEHLVMLLRLRPRRRFVTVNINMPWLVHGDAPGYKKKGAAQQNTHPSVAAQQDFTLPFRGTLLSY